MISKGTTHDNGGRLARYLVTGKEGERAELWELRGFASENIVDAFRSIHVIAEATKAEQPFFHVQVRNPEGETLTREQWQYTADRIERMLGLKDQPRAIAVHVEEKTGERHIHVAWSRIDEETMTAKALPYYKERLKKISRELELHFGLTLVPSERDSSINYAPTRAEDEQARRLGLDVHQVRQTIRDCFDRSDCGRSFESALADEGMILARGDKRDYLVIDQSGGMHALGKRLLDVSAAEVRNRLGDLLRDQLPTVEKAQEFVREQAAHRQPEKPAPTWDRDRDEMAWQNAVIEAAIEKEKAAPGHTNETRGRVHSADKKQQSEKPISPPRAPELGQTAGEIRLSLNLTNSPQAFADALEDRGLFLTRVSAADIPKLTEIEKRHAQEKQTEHDRKLAYLDRRIGEEQHAGNIDKAAELRQRRGVLEEQYQASLPWMARSCAIENLTTEQLAAARWRYDSWNLKETYTFENYISYTQRRWRENPIQTRFQRDDLALVNQHGDVFSLTPRNTGLDREALKDYINHIDPAPLLSVSDVWAVLKDLHEHRREEALWPEREQHWPINPPQPEAIRTSPLYWFEDASRVVTNDNRPLDAPEYLKGDAANIWTAYNRTHDANSFAAALDERGIQLAAVTKEESEKSHRLATFAREIGNWAPVYREGEIVAVSERWHVYKLNERTTGDDRVGVEKFLAKLDRTQLQGIEATKQMIQDRADLRDIERQSFRDLSAVGILKRDKEPRLGKEQISRDPSAAPLMRAGGKVLEVAANIAGEAIETLGNMFGATAMTPERVAAAVDAKEAAAEHQEVDLARFRSDADYRRHVEAGEAQKIEHDRQRRYYEEQQERERQR